jgi:hypothetical protein
VSPAAAITTALGGRSRSERVAAVGHRRDRPALGPGGQAAEPALLLLGRARGLQDRGGQRGAQERHGREGEAELLGDHRELDDAQARAAVLLADRDPRPAQFAELGPQRGVLAAALRAARTAAHVERLSSRSRAVRLMSYWSSERSNSMGVSYRARGRASTRSATMFLRISVVPPSIELPRARMSS